MKWWNKRKELTIIGYYESNFGDLLMLQGIIEHLPEHIRNINILSYGNFSLHDLFVQKDRFRFKVYNCFQWRKQFIAILGALFRSGYCMWGGGTCFNNVDGTGGVKWMLLAKLLGVKVIYFGIGIDLLKNDNNLKKAIRLADYFCVRDNYSYGLSQKYGKEIIRVKDPFLLNSYPIKEKDRSGNYLLIAYRNVDRYFKNSPEYLINFIGCIKSLIERFYFSEIIIIDTDNAVDKTTGKYLYELLSTQNLTIPLVYNPTGYLQEKCLLIREEKLIITGRLHVAYYAFLNQVNFFLLDYSMKNKQFIIENNICAERLVEYASLADKNFLSELYYRYNDVEWRIKYESLEENITTILEKCLS